MILDYSETSWLVFRWKKKLIKLVDRTFCISRTSSAQALWQEGPWLPLLSLGNPETSRPPQDQSDPHSFYCTVNVLTGVWFSRHGGNHCRYSMLGKKGGAVCNILSRFPRSLSSAVSGPIPYRTGTGPLGAQEAIHFQLARTGPPSVCQLAQSRCLLNAGELWNIIGNLEIVHKKY